MSKDERYLMLNMERCTNVVLQGWNMRNAAKFHVFLQDMADVLIEHVTIKVDTDAQRKLLARAGLMSDGTDGLLPAGVPTFPLNTDGLDVMGTRGGSFHCSVLLLCHPHHSRLSYHLIPRSYQPVCLSQPPHTHRTQHSHSQLQH